MGRASHPTAQVRAAGSGISARWRATPRAKGTTAPGPWGDDRVRRRDGLGVIPFV
jgi:hypothetical protein